MAKPKVSARVRNEVKMMTLVDAAGDLRTIRDEANTRYGRLRADLHPLVRKLRKPGEAVLGERYMATSDFDHERTADPKRFLETFGPDVFFAVCQIPLGAAEELVGEERLLPLVTKTKAKFPTLVVRALTSKARRHRAAIVAATLRRK